MRRSDWLTPPLALEKLLTPSVKRWRRRPVWMQREPERAHTHVTHTRHTPDVCALRSLGHGCVQEVKNDINTVRFLTQTLVSCLRPSMCSYDGNCLIWISLCMFFFPLIETVTYTCHYMTDRLERFDLKTSKLDLLKKKRHLHLGCPWGNLIDTTF